MRVKVKKLRDNAVIPSYSKPGDAGLDLTAISLDIEDGCFVYNTGLAVEIPPGHVGLLFPRSSLSKKTLFLTNHVGVIDSGYRGEIKFKFKEAPNFSKFEDINAYQYGDRIGQLIIIPYPEIELVEAEELSETERGVAGFGSTGN